MSEPEKKSSSEPNIGFWAVVICVIAIFMAIALYSNYKPYTTGSANTCINNLRQIDAAAQEFAQEKGKTNGEAIIYPNDLTPYIKLNKDGKIPPCPKGGVYSIKKVGDVPTCSLGTTVTPAHVLP
jgi:type II secretory pathway pseudopilin PulG